jgi:ribonuclease HII
MQECFEAQSANPNTSVDGNSPLFKKRDKNSSGKVFTPAEIDILSSIPNSSIIKGDAKL